MWEHKRRVIAAESVHAQEVGQTRLEHAYYFALYRYGELLCRQWAREAWSDRRLEASARFAVRAVRTRLREVAARRRDAFTDDVVDR